MHPQHTFSPDGFLSLCPPHQEAEDRVVKYRSHDYHVAKVYNTHNIVLVAIEEVQVLVCVALPMVFWVVFPEAGLHC